MTDENVFEDPPWTVPSRGLLDLAPRAVRILSPCVGLDAPKRAAKELKVKWESTGDFEINPKLEPALLPRGWAVDVQHGNSITCCLPQSRPRVFFVGTAASMRASAFQRRILNAPLPVFPSVDIIDFLDHEPSEQDYLNLTMRQQLNVLEQVEGFKEDIAAAAAGPTPSSQSAPTVAICDCARDLCSSVDSQRKHGGTRTLRTNNSHL